MERAYFPCVPPEGDMDCPYRLRSRGCREDTHHEYWPSTDYQTALEHTFRNLEENKVEVCRRMHDEIHAGPPPEKPSHAKMFLVIDAAVDEGRLTLSATKHRKVYRGWNVVD